MKKTIITLFCLTALVTTQAQNTYEEGLIELGRAYKDYMFRAEPSKQKIKELKNSNETDSLRSTALFVIECIKAKSKILKQEFLKLPDMNTLKSMYIVGEVSENMREEGGPDNITLVDSLLSSDIQQVVLVDYYYRTLFVANGNKNQPFDLSKFDFDINSYNLKTDTEKGIFFLRCMDACGTQIWGFMNIPQPPNTGKALKIINKFPKINDQEYYKFTDLYFKDFQFMYSDSVQSYKAVLVHKYYDLLLNHLISIDKEAKGQDAIRDLLLTSVLKDEKLYKYTTHRSTLEQIFKKQEH